MASSKSKAPRSSGTSPQLPGPTQAAGGYNPSRLPENRSDEIIAGAALPLLMPAYASARRSFSCPTRNPMHYNDGPGTDEVVTSRRTQPPLATLLGHRDHEDLAEGKFGVDKNKYFAGPNDCCTLGGAEIYGT